MTGAPQDFVPYADCLIYRLQERYWSVRGLAAFAEGEVPSFATGSYPLARQHAELLLAACAGRPDPLAVLEVGCGSGRLAANLLRALRDGCGEGGRARLRELVYVASDVSEALVRQAAARPQLAAWRRAGRLAPAAFDLRIDERPRGLDGPVPARFSTLLASYVVSVAPRRFLRREAGRTEELLARVRLPELVGSGDEGIERWLASAGRAGALDAVALETRWEPVRLAEAFPDPVHAAIVADALDARGEVSYPAGVVDLLRRSRQLVAPGGLLLFSDYGTTGASIRGPEEREPEVYGNAISHEVDFGVFDAAAARLGLGIARTRDPTRVVDHVALTVGPMSEAVRERFAELYDQARAGEDMVDFEAQARQAVADDDLERALRAYRRCLRLDPGSAALHYRIGELAVDVGYPELALRFLDAGAALEGAKRRDFAFQIGRARQLLGQLSGAEAAYRQSLERDDDPTTHTNLGFVYEDAGDLAAAAACFQAALRLAPADERAAEGLRRVSAEAP